MSVLGFLEVETETVRQAGERTTDSAELWRSWGNRIRISFQHADSVLRSPTIFAAMEEHSERVLPGANRVSQQVYNLGVNTASGATAVENADNEAAGELNQHGQGWVQYESLLRRPINSGGPAPVNGQPVPTL